MLTGHSEKRRVTVARDAGVTEFLAKPISAKGLYQRIMNVVASPRPFIKTKTYFGPDRRRNTSNAYIGPERRIGGEMEVLQQPSLARQGAHQHLAGQGNLSWRKTSPRRIEVKAFVDHHVITQPNPLRRGVAARARKRPRRSRRARREGARRPLRRIQELDGESRPTGSRRRTPRS